MQINLQPKQGDLLEMIQASGPHVPTKLGYGGSRGGGKSKIARDAMVLRRLENPGTVGFIVRRTFRDLDENHIAKFRLEYPEFSDYWRSTDHEYRFPNESRIAFLYGENDQAIERISRGPECMDLFVDQAEQFSEKELQRLFACNRWPAAGPGGCKAALFYNPGGPGTEYLRRVFFKREFHQNEDPADFAFIQAYGWDNYEWFRGELDLTPEQFYQLSSEDRFELFVANTTYGKKLNALPPSLRIGELLGSFEKFSGQYYGAVWDENTCILPVDLAEMLIQPWWTRWMSTDWGFAHHSCHLWFSSGKLSPAQALCLGINSEWPIDVVICYREHVVAERGEDDLARDIVQMTPANERKMISAHWLSPDAFAKRGSANTVAQQLGDVLKGEHLPYPARADDDRIGGWRFLYNGFQRAAWRNQQPVLHEAAQSGPVLLISAACPQVIAAIPMAIRDEDKLEDVLKMETVGDDCIDSLRYGYKSQLDGKRQAPRSVRAQMVFEAAPTATAKHIAMLKFNEAENKKRLVNRQPSWR